MATGRMLDVAVVGGGPVGLYLGLLLARAGLDVQVLERRAAISTHSRAVGLHPPSLEAFDELGLGDEMVLAGVPIRRGVVRGPSGLLGELSFGGVSERHGYVLALPQRETETILEAHLNAASAGVLRRGVQVLEVQPQEGQQQNGRGGGSHVTLCVKDGDGAPRELRARYVVGTDGRRSLIRAAAALPFPGGPYPMTYLMGDFPDTTAYGPDAAITLSAGGVVESFPLPGGRRRWVTQTPELMKDAGPQHLTALLAARTGLYVPAADCTMLSAFEVRRHLAPHFQAGRLLLAGDAAHEVSPIGGQGMNLGWLDARDLAPRLLSALGGDPAPLAAYGPLRRRSAWRAARQAELNMWLGRPLVGPEGHVREALMRGLLASPARSALAQAFTMRGL